MQDLKEINRSENNFKGIVTGSGIGGSTLFLNTDIVKTSMILSQLRVYDVTPKVVNFNSIKLRPFINDINTRTR